jgi:hypothetical protein
VYPFLSKIFVGENFQTSEYSGYEFWENKKLDNKNPNVDNKNFFINYYIISQRYYFFLINQTELSK